MFSNIVNELTHIQFKIKKTLLYYSTFYFSHALLLLAL